MNKTCQDTKKMSKLVTVTDRLTTLPTSGVELLIYLKYLHVQVYTTVLLTLYVFWGGNASLRLIFKLNSQYMYLCFDSSHIIRTSNDE